MKHITVPLIPQLDSESDYNNICNSLRDAGTRDVIDSVNWPEVAAYAPEAVFHIAHSGEKIYILFDNLGLGLKAVNTDNQSPVSQDSCVEFFVQPRTDNPRYWNFEFNAIGAVNSSHRETRPEPTRLNNDEIQRIIRFSSVGTEPFDEKGGLQAWSLLVAIPLDLMGIKFNNRPIEMRANFLKCGSKTLNPHYLSWSPISTEKPDFHQIQYFGSMTLESKQV